MYWNCHFPNIFVFISFIFQFRDENNAYLSSFSIFFLNRIVWSFSAGFMSFGHPPKNKFVDQFFFAYFLLWANMFCHHAESEKPSQRVSNADRKVFAIWKVFATSLLMAEEFPDTLQYLVSR